MPEVGRASGKRPSCATESPSRRWGSTTGEGSRLAQKALFIALVSLPVIYVLSMIWAWRHRAAIRDKSGASGLFSLWFPLLTTLGAAWIILRLAPKPDRLTDTHHHAVPARPGVGAHRNRSDRCAVGCLQARGGVHGRSGPPDDFRAAQSHMGGLLVGHQVAQWPGIAGLFLWVVQERVVGSPTRAGPAQMPAAEC